MNRVEQNVKEKADGNERHERFLMIQKKRSEEENVSSAEMSYYHKYLMVGRNKSWKKRGTIWT